MIRNLTFCCILLLASCLSFRSYSQDCGTDAVHNYMMKHDPDYRKKFISVQKQINTYIQEHKSDSRNQKDSIIYTIPVVVHVFHLGEPEGVGNNISDDQIKGAIQGLNERYSKTIGSGLDMQIRFALAVRDPDGCPTTGINRIDASGIPKYAANGVAYGDTIGAQDYLLKDLSKWPVLDYYNIWVVNKINGGWAGYAYYPWGNEYDGAIMHHSYIAYQYPTLTHELGHALFLAHTFSGDGGNQNCPLDMDCTQDGDWICDTPPHKQGDCGDVNPCTSSGDWDNSRYNYMSYCFPSGNLFRFTPDQKDRVTASMQVYPRANLLNSLAGIPSDFGTKISKTDISCKGICDGSITVNPYCVSKYRYQWNNGDTLSTVNNLCPGTYFVTITNSDNLTAVFPVTLAEPNDIAVSTSVVKPVCEGDSNGELLAKVTGGVPFNCASEFIVGIGNETNVLSDSTYPAVYGNYNLGAKHQFIYLASELKAKGFKAGAINGLALNVADVSGTDHYKNFEIKLGTTTEASINWNLPVSKSVYFASDYQITKGWNTHVFNKPFTWDGYSNILVEFCFSNTEKTRNSPVYFSWTNFNAAVYKSADIKDICSDAGWDYIWTLRPNIRFTVCKDTSFYKYNWSNGQTVEKLTGISAGNYKLTVTDGNGCTKLDTVLFIANPIPVINAGTDTIITEGFSTILGGSPTSTGNGPFIYNWIPPTELDSANIANPKAKPSKSTSYVLIVTDSNGCSTFDTVDVIVKPSSVFEASGQGIDLIVYPNPTSNLIDVYADNVINRKYLLVIRNILGQVIKEEEVLVSDKKLKHQIALNAQPNGIYFLSIETEKGKSITKILKQ